MALLGISTMFAQAVLDGKTYVVDTIARRQIGPGIMHTVVRLPGYPLNVYVLEMDMTSPYNRVETTQASNLLGKTEKLATAYSRHKAAGKKPIAACNASFWCVTSQLPYANFMLGVPHGAEVVNDTIYVNTNTNVDTWGAGPTWTGSTIIDKDKKVHVGRHHWYGYAKSTKFSADQEIIQVNKRCDTGQLTLFNHTIGRDHTFYTVENCDYIFLKLKAGEKWSIANDMKFEVAAITLAGNSQVLGEYDACLVGDGGYKTELEKLAVGDELVINTYWVDVDGDKTPIQVENMTEGNAYVMLHGEMTERNENETYNSQVYSRTAYGTNAEGTKLYMMVIDKSTHPVYGTSAGCNTRKMCELWKFLCPDLYNVANYDAGGSAQMLVSGEVVNKTTEATPRAVANGMMMFSVAPEEDNDVIASIRFEEPSHRIPVCYSYAPNVLGYNKYGELISENVPVTYTCSDNLGTPNADGSAINTVGTPVLGTITAHYGSVETTAPVYVEAAEFAIRIKPMILIDAAREYPIEVTTLFNGVTLNYDPSIFTWEIGDETVVSIENGVLKGLKEGTTTIKATLGDFTDETTVKVEIAKEPKMYQTWNDWTVTSKSLSTEAVLSEDGVITYAYTSGRGATVTLAKDVMIYSLPDSLWFVFTTTAPLLAVTMDIRTGLISDENVVTYGGDGLDVGTHKLDLLAELGDKNDLGLYPVNIKNIIFKLNTQTITKGDNTITLGELCAAYSHNASGIENVAKAESVIKAFPNGGKLIVSASGIDAVKVNVYNLAGTQVYSRGVAINGGTAVLEPELAAGVYLVEVTGGGERTVCKMIIN